MSWKKIIKKKLLEYYDFISEEIFNIGFIENDMEKLITEVSPRIKWLRHHYRSGWFADPFILNISPDQIEVLVEEFHYPTQRGRIDKLTICRKSYKLQKMEVVLELDTHLSFPAIFREGNNVYMYPENAKGNRLGLYFFDYKEDVFKFCCDIINEPLIDAIHFEDKVGHYIISNIYPDNWGKNLLIYKSDTFRGGYKRINTLGFDKYECRSAGNIFRYGNDLIRPVQDCNGAYGKGVILHKMIKRDDSFLFEEIHRFYPSGKRYIGLHTLNVEGEIIVVDGKKYKYPAIFYLIKGFWKLFN